MKTIYSIVVLIVFILVNSSAWSLSDDECDYSGNQSQMNACAERDYAIADKELNQIYKQLMSALAEPKKIALQKQQRSWLKDRDPKCHKEADDEAEGGSMWPMVYQSCRAKSTQERVKVLKKWER